MSIIEQAKKALKEAFMSEKLPLATDMPTIKTLKAISERHTLSSLLPYERYDEESQVYYNSDTYGFMVYCSPSTGLVDENLNVLEGLFKNLYPENTQIQISIISDSNIEHVLDYWAEARTHSMNPKNNDIFKIMADNRVTHLKKGKWQSLIDAQPYILRNYHLVVTVTMPYESGKTTVDEMDIEKLKRLKGMFVSTLSTAKIPAKNFEPAHFISILNGILNPSFDEQPAIEYDDNNFIRNSFFTVKKIINRD